MVFGEIGHVKPVSGLVIFELTIAALVVLEIVLELTKKWVEANDYQSLHEKIKTELLQLGIVSFIIFLGQSAGLSSFTNPEYNAAFELSHIIILFIAFAFVVQACFLVQVRLLYEFFFQFIFRF